MLSGTSKAHAKAKNVTGDVLLQTRLIPDMLPLVRQVQIATDMAKNGAAVWPAWSR